MCLQTMVIVYIAIIETNMGVIAMTTFEIFQNLYAVIHNWKPERHEISLTDDQIADWVRLNK
jgi:hypothetical protein